MYWVDADVENVVNCTQLVMMQKPGCSTYGHLAELNLTLERKVVGKLHCSKTELKVTPFACLNVARAV